MPTTRSHEPGILPLDTVLRKDGIGSGVDGSHRWEVGWLGQGTKLEIFTRIGEKLVLAPRIEEMVESFVCYIFGLEDASLRIGPAHILMAVNVSTPNLNQCMFF